METNRIDIEDFKNLAPFDIRLPGYVLEGCWIIRVCVSETNLSFKDFNEDRIDIILNKDGCYIKLEILASDIKKIPNSVRYILED
jgi:hypothetical protein